MQDALMFRGNQFTGPESSIPLPQINGRAVRNDPTLDSLLKDIFLNALATLRMEAPCQFQAVVECTLLKKSYEEVASVKGTTPDAVRVAKMRGMRNLRRNAGGWVDNFIETIHDAR